MPPRCTLVFDTTNAALWAEEVARGAGIPVDVVPAPADAEATCDLAVVCRLEDAMPLERELQSQGVSYRRYEPRTGS